jgi:hemerythrin superfamily protein
MEIYNYLKKDHQKVTELFEQITTAKNASDRQTLFEELREELLLHAHTEQKTFYKALKKHSVSKDEAKHGDKEHAQVEEYLAKLTELPIKSDEWLITFGELKRAVAHHVKDEETEMFKKARKVLSKKQAKELASEMDYLKQEVLATEESATAWA